MVNPANVILVVVAVLSGMFRAYFKPAMSLLGPFRHVPGLNNERCHQIRELQGCEDMYLHRETGLAYLPCVPPRSRAFWTPALLKYDRDSVPYPTEDTIYILNTATEQVTPLKLEHLPPQIRKQGLHLHGIDLYVDQADNNRATIFAINHRPPPNPADAAKVGADSVVEVFDTILGDFTARWVGTVRHPDVHTPNNLVALSPRSFYVSNDHSEKVHWARSLELIWDRPGANIAYCSVDHGFDSPDCKVAAGPFPHPNGITKGPGSTIYMATSFKPHLRSFEIQADQSLVLVDEVKLPRIIDNINVSPSGAVYLSAFPKPLGLGQVTNPKHVAPEVRHEDVRMATEVWRVRNGTGEESFHGGRLKVEKVFADNGTIVSSTTNALAYNNKLYITGLTSYWVSVCDVAPEFAN